MSTKPNYYRLYNLLIFKASSHTLDLNQLDHRTERNQNTYFIFMSVTHLPN